jgi:hypothetical protein
MREARQQYGWLIAALALASCAGSNPPPAEPQPAPAASTAAPAPAPAPPPPPPARSKSDEALAKMAEFTDEMCACKDSPCAQRVADHMTKWAQEQMSGSEPPKMTDEQTQRAAKIGEQLGACMQTAMGAAPASP